MKTAWNMTKYDIHFQGAVYSNNLYDERGRYIYDLETAIEEAETQFGPVGWEVYNGVDGECNRFEEDE